MNSKTNTIYLKKGSPNEILLEINEKSQSIPFFKKLLDSILEEKFSLGFCNDEYENLVKFYLSCSKNKKTKKHTDSIDIAEKPRSSSFKPRNNIINECNNKRLGSLLTKYHIIDETNVNTFFEDKSAQCETSTVNEKNNLAIMKKEEIEENFVLKMNLLYIDSQIFSKTYDNSLDKINDALQQLKNLKKQKNVTGDEIKYIVLLEGMQSFFSSKNFKKRIEKNLTYSSQISSQEALSLTEEDFRDWLCDITVFYDWEYVLTESHSESLDFIKKAIGAIILQKYKNVDVYSLGKENTHTEKSKIAGFDNEFSLMWIDILMGIPGVSEDKAIAIAKNYPSFKILMDMIEELGIEEAENRLKNLQIYYNYNQANPKNLGNALAFKIIKTLTETDPNKLAKK